MKKLYFKSLFVLGFLLFVTVKNFAQSTSLTAGAFIINMGQASQTINNGLKPYGMVYDLLKNYQVPIKWVINPSKVKDGADFTYNGVQYKGGTFIIPSEFRTTAVNTAITNWVAQGVTGVTTNAAITVDVFKTLLFVPNWTLDKTNGAIAVSFFVNAGIPSTAYGGSSSSGWKDPSGLNSCDDIFVLPHADPTWATHQNLYFWNQTYKGNIWVGCHAGSVLESLVNPGGTIKMNFLSNNGLVLYTNHKDGSVPYTYQFPTDPVMQFMGTFDGSTQNGSEQVYLPNLAGAWRSGSVLGVYDPTQSDIPLKSPGQAAIAIYGRAYSDTLRGFVMYEAGHDLDSKGTVAERVAAERAFFNYSFYATQVKVQIPYIDLSPVPLVMKKGDTVNIDFNLPSGYLASNYTIKWTASCGGTFLPNSATKAAKFIVPTTPGLTSCVITIKLTDACGRENFMAKSVFIVTNILNTGLGALTGKLTGDNVLLNWSTESEQNLDHFIIERSTDGRIFAQVNSLAATGISTVKTLYQYTDILPEERSYYYRVIAVDAQNKTFITNTIYIPAGNNKLDMKVLPNPVTPGSMVSVYSGMDCKIELSLVDMTGKQIYYSSKMVNCGETKIDMKEFRNLTSGIYVLKLKSDTKVLFQKIIVMQH